MSKKLSRRKFVRDTAIAAAAVTAGGVATQANAVVPPMGLMAKASIGAGKDVDTSTILNYNPDMEYRQLGRTGLMISAFGLGGHWKRVVNVIGGEEPEGWMTADIDRADFQKNRAAIVTRCIDRGVNYVDACCREEILAYAKAVKGRRDQIYFGYSWHIRESRFEIWRSAENLKEGFDAGLKEAGLEYVDVWRISLLEDSARHTAAELESVAEALEWAKETGRARFTGVSAHNRSHLKSVIETYPKQIEVILTPYTADTRVISDENGLWATIKKNKIGWFGIKPFATNALFKGNSSPESPHFEEDNRLARMALRYILCNDAITAPIPGLITEQQVDNAALAVMERRELDKSEEKELSNAMARAWSHLPQGYGWLEEWKTV
jgi:aryl-alcohol dehydrogenase-like predicted oxidoreductase